MLLLDLYRVNDKIIYPSDKYYNKKTFDTLQDIFHELNKHPKLKWVVMRNFEDMPDNITIDEHLDVDLLVSDYYLVKTILTIRACPQIIYCQKY